MFEIWRCHEMAFIVGFTYIVWPFHMERAKRVCQKIKSSIFKCTWRKSTTSWLASSIWDVLGQSMFSRNSIKGSFDCMEHSQHSQGEWAVLEAITNQIYLHKRAWHFEQIRRAFLPENLHCQPLLPKHRTPCFPGNPQTIISLTIS